MVDKLDMYRRPIQTNEIPVAMFDRELIDQITRAYRYDLFRGDVVRKAFRPIDRELVGDTLKDQIPGNHLRDIPNLATEPQGWIPPELRAYDQHGNLKDKFGNMQQMLDRAQMIVNDVDEDLLLMRTAPDLYQKKMSRVRIPVGVKEEE